MMNYQISKVSFEDAVFVRLKVENSISLAEAPKKTPHFSSQSPLFHVNSLVKSMFDSKRGSFIEKLKRLKTKPSKQQVNQWIAEKQIQILSMISKEKQLNQAKVISCSDKIVLRPKQQISPKKQTSTPKKLNVLQSHQSSQEQSRSKSPKQRFSVLRKIRQDRCCSQLKLENRKRSITFQQVSESHQKLTEKFLKTPLSHNRKSISKVLQKSSLLQSSLTSRANLDDSNMLIYESQVRSQQNYAKVKVGPAKTRQRSLTLRQKGSSTIESFEISKKTVFPSQKSPKNETKKQTYSNTLYSSPGLSPLKKYNGRDLSPKEQKDLMGKYSQLQNRLDSLLRGAGKERTKDD